MQKKFADEWMKIKLSHWIITNQCLNLRQVQLSKNKLFYSHFFFDFEDHGTSHCSIIDAEGNAVAATSTINTALVYFFFVQHI